MSEPQTSEFDSLSIEQSLAKLETSIAKGLTSEEAKKRRLELGPNALAESKESPLKKLLSFFWGPIPWMIEAAALLSLINGDWQDLIIIVLMLLLNAAIGFVQEHQASNALDALKNQLALRARVNRDGTWQEIDAKELVPGDIIRIRPGDVLPADVKLVEGAYLSIDQAALTGESLPVSKREGDSGYSGSIAKQGEMIAAVTTTGANTFFGRTAGLVATAGAKSHFQEAVMKIGDFLIFAALGLSVVLVASELWRGAPISDLLQFVLVLIVASIPVAMPAVLSVTMALGALALSKMKAIVARLQAIEEMAGVNILCSDKTGTLTQNRLTLGDILPFGEAPRSEVILAAALASKAENQDAIDLAVIGGVADPKELDAYQQTAFEPFDPVSKRTSATIAPQGSQNGTSFEVAKGAPQVIIDLAETPAEDRDAINAQVDTLAAKGLRALGVARKDRDTWRFLGLLSLLDPPREDSAATIFDAKAHGIEVKMVTGDDVAIGREIATQLGIGSNLQPASALFKEGVTAETMPPEAVKQIQDANGFARVFPEHKYGIVKALQNEGNLVAMTGDGVNDAPALKQADVGIAVSGATDAARAAADLILTQPGLSTIVNAVDEARRIFERMLSYTIYRIAMTIDIMVFVVLATVIMDFRPLSAVMIVVLALLDDVPIMTIAYDNTRVSPTPVRWQFGRVLSISCWLGFLSVIQSFGILYLGKHYWNLDGEILQSVVFLQLVAGGHLLLLVTRTQGFFFKPPYPSWQLLTAIFGTQAVAIIMCGGGWPVPQLPWDIIGLVWVYNLVWMLILDGLKITGYKLLDIRENHHHHIWQRHNAPVAPHLSG